MKKKAYAKVNLFLNVKGKREDGFHDLEMVNIMINLADELDFELTDSEVEVVVYSKKELNGKNNLAYKVAEYLKKVYKVKEGVRITIDKKIPIGSGLGGGSSDAACALSALNELWNLNISNDELFEISKKFGSDTPYCFYQAPAIVTGTGDEIEALDIDISNFEILLFNKGVNVSTGTVFKNLKSENSNKYSLSEAVSNLTSKDYKTFIKGLKNDLQDTVFKLYPEVKNQYETLKNIYGEDGLFMTGSGSTIIKIKEKQ
ncbi:MAG: 4-(cytidine 5'-diphospho)-2-C-methyl-D-erythritol kinase [Gammaproteobacteria bacterium]|nr:4-(cytidine 5'-diphospho)-2-C-methyl-D-erythritol kinase [Gammaproteobacteria bacterium]